MIHKLHKIATVLAVALCFAVLASHPFLENSLAGAALADDSANCRAYASVADLPMKIEVYQGTPYFFLGNGHMKFTVSVKPQQSDALDLLWGSKNDTRAAQVSVNGQSQKVTYGGYQGFRWLRVKLPQSERGDQYQVTVRAGQGKAAFVAAVRLVDGALATDAAWQPPQETRNITFVLPETEDGWPVVPSFADLPPLQRNARQAQRALQQSDRFVRGWLTTVDPESGLIPENLTRGLDRWNGRNNAADNYPFMVLTAALTDRSLYDGQLLEMLRTEQRLTSRIDRLGDVYKFSTRRFEHEQPDLTRIIFDNSEYVKDGLMPLTEWLGASPWSQRMSGIIDDIWKHAPIDTPGGKIPSTNAEVNGEMMQLTSRYFWMTGERVYLERAIRIADWYLLGDRHPTRHGESLRLRDHGCELLSGLTEVYFACSHADKAKAAEYRKPLYEILDSVLRDGTNSDGMMFNAYNPKTGDSQGDALSDTWGYNYNGFYTVYMVDGVERYRDAVRHALSNLNKYRGYAWEGHSHDGYADSIESALNLYNREPVAEAADWIDSQMRIMLAMQQEDGIIGGWHGDGNFARTVIMYALWKQQGVSVQPWRADVRLGALVQDGELRLQLAADKPWQGRLVFDAPRHKTVMKMPQDYPRINQFPEWFTVEDDLQYSLLREGTDEETRVGRQLRAGVPVEVTGPEQVVSIVVRR